MKYIVKYYDIETDRGVEKECIHFSYDDENSKSFSFTPINHPVKIYKSVVINHPVITTFLRDGKFKLIVVGYQYTKNSGYEKTTTVIYNKYEE